MLIKKIKIPYQWNQLWSFIQILLTNSMSIKNVIFMHILFKSASKIYILKRFCALLVCTVLNMLFHFIKCICFHGRMYYWIFVDANMVTVYFLCSYMSLLSSVLLCLIICVLRIVMWHKLLYIVYTVYCIYVYIVMWHKLLYNVSWMHLGKCCIRITHIRC